MSMAEPRDLMDVLARLEQASPDHDDPGKRRFKRYSVRHDAKLEAMSEDSYEEPLTVLLRDISRGGAGFLVDRFLEPSTFWRLRFMAHGHVAGSQPIVLRFCRMVQENLFLAGGQFVLEPYIMHELGVSDTDLQREDVQAYTDEDVSRFLAPDDLDF